MDQSRSVPALATAYGLSRAGLQRHYQNHMKVSLEQLRESNNLLTLVRFATELYERASANLGRAEAMLQEEGTTPKGLQALASSLREVRQSIELLARMVTSEPDHSDDERANDALDALITEQVLAGMDLPELPAGTDISDAELVDPDT